MWFVHHSVDYIAPISVVAMYTSNIKYFLTWWGPTAVFPEGEKLIAG